MKDLKNIKGITLISLIVTIIMLLILSSIAISTITGNNGLINSATAAKEETEISNEKEIIKKAISSSIGTDALGILKQNKLQKELDKETGEGKTIVSDSGNKFEILFKKNNRYYTVDKDGNVSSPKEKVKDNNPGDITKGKNGETLDGSQEHPFEIWCIEDLVVFSNMVNGNGVKYENGKIVPVDHKESFLNQYIELKQDLDFKSEMSYVNSKRTDFGNINGIEDDDNTLINEMITGTGFIPIGSGEIEGNDFCGNFEGNNFKIDNIYINRSENAALFGIMNGCNIADLEISGEITATAEEGCAAGFVAVSINNRTSSKIENCKNNAKISGDYVAGIVGFKKSSPQSLTISNCENKGEINGGIYVGGIVGDAYIKTTIINCYNTGKISGGTSIEDSGVGGIVGTGMFTTSIINSYNIGNIISAKTAGGILGWVYWSETHIENCYNVGNVSGKTVGGILGGANISNELFVTQNNCFLDSKTSKGIGQGPNESDEDINSKTMQEMKSQDFVNILNEYVTENTLAENVNLKKWIKGENGYPKFE